jgi:hypothetical protein
MKTFGFIRRSHLLWLCVPMVGAQAATLYVSTQGSDSNSGTSAQPVRTITRAYALASAGTTIMVAPGVYTDYQSGWGLRLGKSGTASSPIILKSQVKWGAIIDGQNASDRYQAIYIDGSYNVVDGFEIRGGPDGGISIWGSGNQILNNHIHHNGTRASSSGLGQDGIYSSQSTANNRYIGNFIRDNGRPGSNLDHALYLCGDNEWVLNNVLLRNASWGLHIAGYTTVSNLKAYNNVIAHNGKGGIMIWMAVSGVDIKNNIIFQNGQYGLTSFDAHGSGVVVDRNLVFGNSSGNYNFTAGNSDYSYSLGTTISSAPQFVNSTYSGFDAQLSSSSPAIGAGLNLSSIFTTDVTGATRPSSGAWDLGAYAYGSSSSDNMAPTVSITSPANGATVSNNITVSANASDNVGVASVQFTWDGANLGSALTSAPYSISVNTTTGTNGPHTLSAVARDAAGNQTTSSAVIVQVKNPVNTAPQLSSIANQTVTTGSTIGPLAFTVSDAETSAASLSVMASSSNPTLVPNANIVLGGSGSNRTVTITPAAARTGTATITLAASDGALTRSTNFLVTINALPPGNGLTIASTVGSISAPFVVGVGTISQPAYSSLTGGGKAVYSFSVPTAGDYTVTALVSAPTTGENSFFVNIDGEPTDPLMIWDVPISNDMTAQTVSWRGDGGVNPNTASGMNASFAPKVFTLSAGEHQLIVRGREANVQLGTITLTAIGGSGGTIPGKSVPGKLSHVPGEGARITWSSVVGTTYRVSSKDGLASPTWTDLSGPIIATATTTTYIDESSRGKNQRFYIVDIIE